ncbi:MAG TPA: protein translocase subunit SecD [Egicoccus sp.]|nr:protein translocase subunit SecD [Egicoccus sp.]HSK24451.1 protein translocase subunit SecD [Egicoccus sp.]
MNKGKLVATLTVTLLVVVLAGTYLGLGNRPNLGLDLQGGISAVYTAELEGDEPEGGIDDILDQTVEVIRARVDSLGVAEPDISRAGNDIIVQLPGVSDDERADEIIGTTAQLEFRPVEELLLPGDPGYDEGPDCTQPVDEREELEPEASGIVCGAPSEDGPAEGTDDAAADEDAATSGEVTKYRLGPVALTGERIDDAFPTVGQQGGFEVSLELDDEGGERWAQITGELACERDQGQPGMLAIVLDNVVESAPGMNPGVACGVGITGGQASITTGGGSQEEQEQEALDLSLVLRTGALPISLTPATFDVVSPTLGSESLRSGLLAGLIGLALVGVWLVFFYRLLGVVALLALGIFGVVTLALITALGEVGFALTLAGIAGIIVSLGITADSSILFFERIRDEANLGKTVRTSVKTAFASAFRTNLAGNTVTLAAAVILYFLAVGPVRGFALMLGLASVLDIIIMTSFTRPVVYLLSGTKALNRRTVRASEVATTTAGGRR